MRSNEFIAFWHEKNVSSAEKRLATKFEVTKEQLGQMRTELLSYLRPQKTPKGIAAIFDDEALPLMDRYDSKQAELDSLKAIIEEFTALVGGPSLDPLMQERHRLKKFLEAADNEVRICTLRVVKKGKSEADALANKDVVAALAKKDRIVEEHGSRLKDIEARIKKANAILTKH